MSERRKTGWRRPSPLVDSIAILYDYGLTPRETSHRLSCATETVKGALSWLTGYWSATDWSTAAAMHVASMRSEAAA